MKWFKHMSNAHRDKTMKGIFRKFGLEGEARFWRLIELMAESFNNNDVRFEFDLETIRESLRFRSPTDCRLFMDALATLSEMKIEYSGNDCVIIYDKLLEIKDNHSRNLQVANKKLTRNLPPEEEEETEVETEVEKEVDNMPEYIPSFDSPIHKHPLEITSDNTQKENPLPKPPKKSVARTPKLSFDIDSLYALYPNKEGKKRGIEKFERLIDTEKKFCDLKSAILNYSQLSKGQDKKYIKHFSTFSGCWEDYVSLEVVGDIEDKYGLKEIFKERQ